MSPNRVCVDTLWRVLRRSHKEVAGTRQVKKENKDIKIGTSKMKEPTIKLSPTPTKKGEVLCWYCSEMKKYPEEFPAPHYAECEECGKRRKKMRVDKVGIWYMYKEKTKHEDEICWLWPWRRKMNHGNKILSIYSEGGFKSFEELEKFWDDYFVATRS